MAAGKLAPDKSDPEDPEIVKPKQCTVVTEYDVLETVGHEEGDDEEEYHDCLDYNLNCYNIKWKGAAGTAMRRIKELET